MTIASNIVVEWLHSLHLGEHAESFIDNGYDDLEICKQISEPDLDAIGVFKQSHRLRLLQSVKRLREEGAASVYFTLEESSACLCEDLPSPPPPREKQELPSLPNVSPQPPALPSKQQQIALPPTPSYPGCHQTAKFLDEYEEGKAELVRIPRMQLRLLLQEKLRTDGIRLACQPYTTPEGERGYLEGLASRYADLLRTHYGDVLEPLEELRRCETNASPRLPSAQLTSSHSQPIYVPGKYSPSSCLSDKEEDEIYGFGYGVFGRQMMQQRQQKLALATQNLALSNPAPQHQSIYQSCLSPRSAFFYEFPPNEQGQNTSKKKTTFSRILRGLKTHRKEKHSQIQNSPRHNPPRMGVPQRVSSCILRDIRQGLMQLGRDGQAQYPVDDTYMYDEEARCGDLRTLEVMGGGMQHWYDEPPYESDPEDFLMGCNSGETNKNSTMDNDRMCYALDINSESRSEGVISLRSAGDISLPKERPRKTGSTMRGLILPQGHNNPPTIIPLTHSRTSRESGEYASSDVQSRSSGEEDNVESPRSQSTDYEDPEPLEKEANKWNLKKHSRMPMPPTFDSCGSGNVGGGNIGDGSGIAGRARTLRHDVQRKISRLRQQRTINETAFPCSTSSVESLPSGSGSSSTQALVRAGSNHSSISCEEREPSSPQRVDMKPGAMSSNPSTSLGSVPVLCRARAIVDCLPSPYDKEALAFKKGDTIDVLQMSTSGLWKGVVHNRFGHFKFINVEVINDRYPRRGKWGQKYKQKPGSVPELLQRMNLQEYISVFLLNGYEDLELFRELEPADLDYLRIQHPEHRAKILTAVQLLHDLQSGSEGEEIGDSSSEPDEVSGLGYGMSRLGIGRQPFQRVENDLNSVSTDNQPTEFQANVPLRFSTNTTANATHVSASVNQ